MEDDQPLRNALARTFERQSFHVRAAASIKEAYRIADTFEPECVVLDLSLKDVHGMEIVR